MHQGCDSDRGPFSRPSCIGTPAGDRADARWSAGDGYVARIDAEDDVRAANAAFYEAFEARDIDAMSEVWEHSDRVVCTHPGWQSLRGWGAVSGSWFALFRGDNALQFILTNEVVTVEGDVGWVTNDENLIGERIGGTVAAFNLFVSDGERWRMVAHHGSPVGSTV